MYIKVMNKVAINLRFIDMLSRLKVMKHTVVVVELRFFNGMRFSVGKSYTCRTNYWNIRKYALIS